MPTDKQPALTALETEQVELLFQTYQLKGIMPTEEGRCEMCGQTVVVFDNPSHSICLSNGALKQLKGRIYEEAKRQETIRKGSAGAAGAASNRESTVQDK